ncbi:MAG: C_GCAxxG_C_C family protein [Acholeplasmatales bacterium]|nr:C_GCAxxG_C_C family protein [Acholeplasmatales bacterium]
MDRIEKAVELKNSGKFNCAEAIVMAYSDLVDVDKETLLKIASGFGTGMGSLEATCGALVGANIILGLLNNSETKTKFMSKNMLKDFNELSHATICKDLKGIETGVVLCPCDMCVRNASKVLEKTLKDNNL